MTAKIDQTDDFPEYPGFVKLVKTIIDKLPPRERLKRMEAVLELLEQPIPPRRP